MLLSGKLLGQSNMLHMDIGNLANFLFQLLFSVAENCFRQLRSALQKDPKMLKFLQNSAFGKKLSLFTKRGYALFHSLLC